MHQIKIGDKLIFFVKFRNLSHYQELNIGIIIDNILLSTSWYFLKIIEIEFCYTRIV